MRERIAIRHGLIDREAVLYVIRVVPLPCGLTVQRTEFVFIGRLCGQRLPDQLGATRFLTTDGRFTEFPKVRT